MVDRIMSLPAPVRHWAAVFIGTFVVFLANSVIANGGIAGLGTEVLWDALDAAALALAALATLALTPLTDAYGVGAKVKDFEIGNRW